MAERAGRIASAGSQWEVRFEEAPDDLNDVVDAACRRRYAADPYLSHKITTTLVTKLLTNPLAQSRSTADAGDQSPGSAPVHHTGRLSMAWKRSVDSSRARAEIQPRRLTREAHINS
jgi:hypothetical protein